MFFLLEHFLFVSLERFCLLRQSAIRKRINKGSAPAPGDVHCETHRGAVDRRADVVSGCRRSRTALALTLQQAIDLTHLFRRQRPVRIGRTCGSVF